MVKALFKMMKFVAHDTMFLPASQLIAQFKSLASQKI